MSPLVSRSLAFTAALAIVAGTVMSPAVAAPAATRKFVKQFVKRYVSEQLTSVHTVVAAADAKAASAQSAVTAHKASGDHDARYWGLGGNAGTGGTARLGTTDAQPLVLQANGERALRLEGATVGSVVIPNVIGGWSGNGTGPATFGATIGGGGCPAGECGLDPRPNTVTGNHGTIAGGDSNTASGPNSSIGGGRGNTAGPSAFATVGGGSFNSAQADYAFVGGGDDNSADGTYATVGGGFSNSAGGLRTTVGGGDDNSAGGIRATVGGGFSNSANGLQATVGGGFDNFAGGEEATVAGGDGNSASGIHATVPGGVFNSAAGNNSLAAGSRGKVQAAHHGAFVWADSTPADYLSAAANEFAARATGGVRFVTAVDGGGTPTTTCGVAGGGASWACSSDRAVKTDVRSIDPAAVLQGVASLPLSTWRFEGEDSSIRHLGPMAQDFHAAFGLGDSDRSIGMLDGQGVALASIQGLNAKVERLEARLAAGGRPERGPLAGLAWALAALALGIGLGIGATIGGRVVRP